VRKLVTVATLVATLTACQSAVKGTVTGIIPPSQATTITAGCSYDDWIIAVATRTVQKNPLTGVDVEVRSTAYVCASEAKANRYAVGDPYP
jgi:hypothetical protein